MPVPVLARPNQQATNQQALQNTIAPETVDTLVVVDRRTDERLPVAAEPSAATNAPLVRFSQLRRMAVSHVGSRTGPVAPEIFTLAATNRFVADATGRFRSYCIICRHAVGQFGTYG